MRLPSFHGSSEEPLRLLRITAGALLLLGTVIAIALALSGVAPRAIELIGIFWAIYGFLVGITSGVLEPVIDGVARALMDWGLIRAGGGWSAIETMVARGQLEAAAEEYLSRAKDRGTGTFTTGGSTIPVARWPSCGASSIAIPTSRVRRSGDEPWRR